LSLWQFITEIAGYHLIPCLLASAVIYLAVLLLFGPGRVRRPQDRVLFLYAALAKATLALWAGAGISCLAHHPRLLGYFVVRLPDVWTYEFAVGPRMLATVVSVSHVAESVLLIVSGAIILLLCWRWYRLAPFYSRIYEQRRCEPGEFPIAFRTFEELVDRAYDPRSRLPRPRLMVVRETPCAAFTMGLRPPIVVVSAGLAKQLTDDELRGVLAHELGHVRRFDYLGRWLAGVLKDILIWNPFAVLWYDRLQKEQERASDGYAADLLEDPVSVAGGLVAVATFTGDWRYAPPALPSAWRASDGVRDLNERLDRLAASMQRPETRPGPSAVLLYMVLAGFCLAEPRVAVSIPTLWASLSTIL
jgi:Zn-dependent protease with chaperone function